MPKLGDLADHLDTDLVLPILGIDYRIPSPGITESDRLAMVVVDTTLTELQTHAEAVKILGTVRLDMADNGVPDPMAEHAGRTALVHFGMNARMAASYWRFAPLVA